jgi:RNA polymerase sigma-70 factor (ECF subfamily)
MTLLMSVLWLTTHLHHGEGVGLTGKDESGKSEESLIAAILSGDPQRFHDLIRPYERTVYMMALSYMKNEADAEDVAQEAFIRAFRNLASFRAEARFSTWLISITLNEARTRLRRSATTATQSLDETGEDGASVSPALLRDWREIPSDTLERQEIRDMLGRAVEDLPNIYRQVFLLRDVEELSINETAATLNIGVPLVKVRLHRARLMLQKQLTPQLKAATKAGKRRWFQWS